MDKEIVSHLYASYKRGKREITRIEYCEICMPQDGKIVVRANLR